MLSIEPMTKAAALEISTWQYGGEYSMYDFMCNEETLNELLNGDYYSCSDEGGQIVGFFCYGSSARIPIEEDYYGESYLDIGLGLKPSLCGTGLGPWFMREGMEYAHKFFGSSALRLTVACFNRRAIDLYQKMGFVMTHKVVHRTTAVDFMIMVRPN